VELSLNHRKEGEQTVLEVAGEVDVYTAPKLREKLVELVGEGHHHLVVDMTKVEFLDSTGLGVLVGGLKRVRSHEGSLALVCNQERILKIFRITGLTKVFPIHDSLDEALKTPPDDGRRAAPAARRRLRGAGPARRDGRRPGSPAWPSERVEDLRIAVSEATTNAIRAHQRSRQTDPVVLRFGPVAQDGFTVTIADVGPGFDPSEQSEQQGVRDWSDESGLGLTLIKELASHVEFENTGGMNVRMSFTVGLESEDGSDPVLG
jgi:anti-sigma B factor antagonist